MVSKKLIDQATDDALLKDIYRAQRDTCNAEKTAAIQAAGLWKLGAQIEAVIIATLVILYFGRH